MFRGLFVSVSLTLSVVGYGTAALAAPLTLMLPELAAADNPLNSLSEISPAEGILEPADPALMLEPFTPPSPEDALFTVEEAAVPFLGLTEEDTSRVHIAVRAPGYEDLFTIYFPRGTAHLTLAAEDMIAMAAESVRGMDGLEVWIAAAPALNKELSLERTVTVYEILRQNDMARTTIHIDDGSYDAVMDRPTSLSLGTES